MLSITRRRVTVTATAIEHIMGAHLVTPYKAETAHHTEVQAAEGGTPITAVRPVTQFRAETARPTEVPLVLDRATATTTVEWFEAVWVGTAR